MQERPAFRDLHHALTWALRYDSERRPTELAAAHKAFEATKTPEFPHGRYQEAADKLEISAGELRQMLAPIHNPEPAPVRGRDPDLDPVPYGQDALGQVGLIRSFVARQPTPEKWHLLAKFAVGDERRQAQRALRDYLIPLSDHVLRHRNTMFLGVAHYYGLPVDVKALAKRILYLIHAIDGEKPENRLSRARRMVVEVHAEIEDFLKGLATRAEESATEELKARGVIA